MERRQNRLLTGRSLYQFNWFSSPGAAQGWLPEKAFESAGGLVVVMFAIRGG